MCGDGAITEHNQDKQTREAGEGGGSWGHTERKNEKEVRKMKLRVLEGSSQREEEAQCAWSQNAVTVGGWPRFSLASLDTWRKQRRQADGRRALLDASERER